MSGQFKNIVFRWGRIFLLIATLFVHHGGVCAEEWLEEKSKHFIIYFESKTDGEWARRVLRESERYYDRIADQIGYTRYHNFWTWDERVKIYIYPDQETFVEKTGQPSWARASAGREMDLLRTRRIKTFKLEEGFLDEVLPHEISHLILRDFMGKYEIPIWFDEGVAQLQERDKKMMASHYMKKLSDNGYHLPFELFLYSDIRNAEDPTVVSLFYIQSVSVVDFLMTKYGSYKFAQLCSEMRQGHTFNDALLKVYATTFSSIEDFEKKWLRYMRQ